MDDPLIGEKKILFTDGVERDIWVRDYTMGTHAPLMLIGQDETTTTKKWNFNSIISIEDVI